jgi:hypothetical protein
MMVKVLIYSSKELFDKSSYEGRAEAHIIAYKKDDGYYQIIKNRTTYSMGSYMTYESMKSAIRLTEEKEWQKEIADVAQR